jgi:hypothetical protein
MFLLKLGVDKLFEDVHNKYVIYKEQQMFKARWVKPLEDYKIRVRYADGVEGVVSLAHLKGKGVFKLWDNYENFKKVKIDPESSAISWGNDIDICPDAVYFEIAGIDPEEYFNAEEQLVVNA